MSDDIRAGDVVVCVDVSRIRCKRVSHLGSRFKLNALYRVAGIQQHTCGCTEAILAEGLPGLITRFRKIDAADDKFVADMRALKPIPVAAGYGQKVVVR